jgi:ketosteroid isomerase-like protein
MPLRPTLLAVALALPLAACTQKAADARADSGAATPTVAANVKADEDSIRAIGKRWVDIVARHDTVAWGALFADDGKTFVPNAPAAVGPAGVTGGMGNLYRIGKDVKLTFEPSDIAVAQGGDLAVERGTWQMSWTDAKGKAMSDHGNYVTAWKKVNGQWKVYADINASEVPMPGM